MNDALLGLFYVLAGARAFFYAMKEEVFVIIIKNATLIEEGTGNFIRKDLRIEQGLITAISEDEIDDNQTSGETDVVIDALGRHVFPGFIDLHVHLREPGYTHKETIFTGTKACAKGGYTTVFCMPNTQPALDTAKVLNDLQRIIEKEACIHVIPVGAITKGIAGHELTDHKALIDAGAGALSDDGKTTMNSDFMIAAFENSKALNIPVMTHSEDHEVTKTYKETLFPTEAESDIVIRDIELCKRYGGHLHVSHVSSKASVDAIREAKKMGLHVTCEVAPHHFALSDANINPMSPLSKVNPPIRSEHDRLAILEAIADGTIDAIATDHAPHEMESKQGSFSDSSFGISGIETAFTIAYKVLVMGKIISLKRLIEMLTVNPAKIGGLSDRGKLQVGMKADLTVIDLNEVQIISSDRFISKGKNTPFNGFEGLGTVILTLCEGNVVYKKEGQ